MIAELRQTTTLLFGTGLHEFFTGRDNGGKSVKKYIILPIHADDTLYTLYDLHIMYRFFHFLGSFSQNSVLHIAAK
jgi:hypothetical protein